MQRFHLITLTQTMPCFDSAAGDAQQRVRDLERERDRLMQLLAAVEADKAALAHDRNRLALAAAPASVSSGGGGAGSPAGSGAGAVADSLAVQLQEERSKRQRAERDFAQLMESIEADDASGGLASGKQLARLQVGHVNLSSISSRTLNFLHACMWSASCFNPTEFGVCLSNPLQNQVQQLEAEKQQLEDSLSRTQALMGGMQADLGKVQSDYGVTSTFLQQLLDAQGAICPGGSSAASSTNSQHSGSRPVSPSGFGIVGIAGLAQHKAAASRLAATPVAFHT